MSSLIEKVKSVCQLQEAEEEIVELFEEEVHDPTKTGISHQVYLKDFDWIPIEDQFRDCSESDKDDIELIFEIKKIKCEVERKEAVKRLI